MDEIIIQHKNTEIKNIINLDNFNKFIDTLKFYEVKGGETVYLLTKNISQEKIRNKDFKITRQPDKADFIIISDFEVQDTWYYPLIPPEKNAWTNGKTVDNYTPQELEKLINLSQLGYSFVYEKDFYENLHSYKAGLELFNTLNDLLSTNDSGNIKMAMEIMTTVDWKDNEIYIKELFSEHYNNKIRPHTYKNSISYQGFLKSLDFRIGFHYREADSYAVDCKSDEHHKFVFDKYKEDFDNEINQLFSRYKLKIDKLEYSIDKVIPRVFEELEEIEE